MLELGASVDADPVGDDLISDTTEAQFMDDVIEASKLAPIIVDFWAPWCGPCKALGPMLEDSVVAAKGKVRMVKLDVDHAPMVAQQLNIQSIPMVYAFWQGQPVDGFQGAISRSEVETFVKRVAAFAVDEDGGLADALAAAEEMLEAGAAEDAAQTFSAILGEDGNNPAAYGGLARAHVAMDDLDQAEAILKGAPAEISEAAEIETVRAQIALIRQAAETGPVNELRARLQGNPDDLQTHFDLALALHGAGDIEAAVDELLEIFRKNRDWNAGAAKTQLFTVFDSLSAQDPIALAGRRRLSSMIFV
jgi:putative thioredoxin